MSSIDTVRKNKRKRKSLGAIKGKMKEKEENKKKTLAVECQKNRQNHCCWSKGSAIWEVFYGNTLKCAVLLKEFPSKSQFSKKLENAENTYVTIKTSNQIFSGIDEHVGNIPIE